MVDIEKLLEEIIDDDVNERLDELLAAISDRWVYFFFNESGDADTRPSHGNVEVVLFTTKDNPILVPLVENRRGCNGVIYTNLELAIRSAEFDCKIAKMRGRNAFRFFSDIQDLDSVYIQGDYGNVRPSNKQFSHLCTKLRHE